MKPIKIIDSCVCSIGKQGADKPCILHLETFYKRTKA